MSALAQKRHQFGLEVEDASTLYAICRHRTADALQVELTHRFDCHGGMASLIACCDDRFLTGNRDTAAALGFWRIAAALHRGFTPARLASHTPSTRTALDCLPQAHDKAL